MARSKVTVDTTGIKLAGSGVFQDDLTVEQDAGRGTADMEEFTVMVRDATTEKLKPMTSLTDVTTESYPVYILWETVAAADIVAGDVTNVKALKGGFAAIMLDEAKIVLENSLTLESLITVPAGAQRTIRTALEGRGIYCRDTYVNDQVAPV